MSYLRNILAAILLMQAALAPSLAQTTEPRPDLAAFFTRFNATGSFALRDDANDHLLLVNAPRAEIRRVPASTFKIAHGLIALHTGAVASMDEVLPYGGAPQRVKAWEQDMSLRSAIRVSNVAIFQQLTQRIGPNGYRDFFADIPYGNAKIGTDLTRFWIDGPLKISPIEQTRFLADLATGRLPISPQHQRALRDALWLNEKNGRKLFGKTGWSTTPDPAVGWFVGWVEADGRVTSFALEIEMNYAPDQLNRRAIALAILDHLDVF